METQLFESSPSERDSHDVLIVFIFPREVRWRVVLPIPDIQTGSGSPIAQLKLRPGLADIGEAFGKYGELLSGICWLPFVGPWIERGRGATKIVSALAALDKPIVVVLDDIDRPTTSEIRDYLSPPPPRSAAAKSSSRPSK